MANYYTLLTPVGLAKVANAQLTQSKVAISHIAVGDSNGTNYPPTGNETALKKEKWRGSISGIAIDSANPNWIVVEAILPATVGGFTLREVALYDEVGDMIAIGNYPDTYKPVASDGSTMDLVLRTIIEVSNADSVTLKIDPNVIVASRKYVDDKFALANTNLTEHSTDTVSDGVHGMGSAAAQTYEEGLWTPNLSSTGAVYSIQQGRYTRVGNVVHINAKISLTSKGTTSQRMRISGLPYVGKGDVIARLSVIASGISDPDKKLNGFIGSLNEIGIYFDNNTSLTALPYQLTIDNISDNSEFIVSGFYII